MEQSSSECNSKEGATIVSADKDFIGKKRNKRSSKSKSSNSSSKHEASTSSSVTSSDAELTQKQNQMQHNKSNNNTNNNESSTVSIPIQKTENLSKVKETKVTISSKPSSDILNKPKETKSITSNKSSSVEKPKNITAPGANISEQVFSKQNSNAKSTSQKDSMSLSASEKQKISPVSEKQKFEKITSPVEVTPEPPANDVKKSVLAMGRLLEPRLSQPIATVANNPWPKYIREIQRCLNSLDRLNDELNMNCDYAASEISDLFGEMQIALQNREHYLLLELETLRNTASALLAERWDLGTALKKKVTRMNVFTPDSNRELQQEIQQYIADRKLDKDIANKCRFAANRRDGLHYAKNFGHVESILPTYTSLIMANSKLKTDDTMLQEVPYSVMEVMPVETGYTETGWVNKQLLPLDLSSYGPYAAIMNPVKDLQVISMDQMMFIQPQPFVTPTQVMTTQQASPKSESTEPRKSSSDESDKAREDTKPTLERVYSKLSAEELLVIQNRVRESLLKQGVKLYPPDGMEEESGSGRSKPLLTSAQREKKRQKRHRYRERKRLERRAERMEQASDSSNSAVETTSAQQQPEAKVASSKHKKSSHKKDKSKTKLTTENEGSKSPLAKEAETIDVQSKVGSPAQVVSRIKPTKLPRKQTNSEQGNASQTSGSTTDTTESQPKSRNSYAENTTSGEEPSIIDDTNMSPASEATADGGDQLADKSNEPSVNSKKDQTKLTAKIKNCNTEDNTDT